MRLLNLDLDSALRQKAKMKWVHLGAENTRFFHQSIKHCQRMNRITCLRLRGEDITDPSLIQYEFYQFYTNLFCVEFNKAKINLDISRNSHILTDAQRGLLNLLFSREEVKVAMWSISEDKAPGLNGFNSKFYKAAWKIMGDDIVAAINQFFCSGKVARSWNTTTITLIPKVKYPSHSGDFRPISYCH